MKYNKYNYLILRRKLYSVTGEIGTLAEHLDLTPLNEAYQEIANGLDKFDEYGIQMGYIDSDTLEST